METSTMIRNIHRRIIKNFLDVLVLAELRKGAMTGYDVIVLIHDKFHFLVSSGTVYSTMYSLERSGLISSASNYRRRVYRLTAKGEETIRAIMSANDKIRYLVSTLLKTQR